jgi:hypothetical protein
MDIDGGGNLTISPAGCVQFGVFPVATAPRELIAVVPPVQQMRVFIRELSLWDRGTTVCYWVFWLLYALLALAYGTHHSYNTLWLLWFLLPQSIVFVASNQVLFAVVGTGELPNGGAKTLLHSEGATLFCTLTTLATGVLLLLGVFNVYHFGVGTGGGAVKLHHLLDDHGPAVVSMLVCNAVMFLLMTHRVFYHVKGAIGAAAGEKRL